MKKTWLKAAGLCLAVSLIFGGCASSGKTAESTDKAEARIITDEGGNQVELPEKITKVAITPIPWASAVWTVDGGSVNDIPHKKARTVFVRAFFAGRGKTPLPVCGKASGPALLPAPYLSECHRGNHGQGRDKRNQRTREDKQDAHHHAHRNGFLQKNQGQHGREGGLEEEDQ